MKCLQRLSMSSWLHTDLKTVTQTQIAPCIEEKSLSDRGFCLEKWYPIVNEKFATWKAFNIVEWTWAFLTDVKVNLTSCLDLVNYSPLPTCVIMTIDKLLIFSEAWVSPFRILKRINEVTCVMIIKYYWLLHSMPRPATFPMRLAITYQV